MRFSGNHDCKQGPDCLRLVTRNALRVTAASAVSARCERGLPAVRNFLEMSTIHRKIGAPGCNAKQCDPTVFDPREIQGMRDGHGE